MAPTNVQYLRIPRYAFFAITTSLCIATIGLAAWSLRDSQDKEDLVAHTLAGAKLHVSDIVGAGGAVVAAAGVSAILCIGLFIATLLSPRRIETLSSIRVKEGLFAFVLVFLFATLVPSTVFAAQRSGHITAPGIPKAIIERLVAASGLSLAYKDQRPVLAFVIVGWIAFLSTAISLVLVSLAARKAKKHHNFSGSNTPETRDEMTTANTTAPASTVGN
ncbi:uncharacterized protein JCM15063_003053 [Sporobolomyces koalae]|uniref:uncharacterized protein n=1 Tax=Sporobolomyces koalae TaxID=500713 RepID=UPI00316E5B68